MTFHTRPLLLCLVQLAISLPVLASSPGIEEPTFADEAAVAAQASSADPSVDVAGLLERLGYHDHVARGIARFNTSVVERKIEGLEDRRERQRRRERLEAVSVRIEEALSWQRIAPLVESAWLEHLSAEQLTAFTEFLDTPAGVVYAEKGMNALAEAGIDQAIYLDTKIDEVFDRPSDVRPPRLRTVREPAPHSHEGLALRWLRLHDPEMPQVFTERQAKGLADARLAFQSGDEDGAIDPDHQKILNAFEQEIRLPDLEQIAVKRITDALSQAELRLLLPAFEAPEMQAFMAARSRADRDLGEQVANVVQTDLQPSLMIEMMRILID